MNRHKIGKSQLCAKVKVIWIGYLKFKSLKLSYLEPLRIVPCGIIKPVWNSPLASRFSKPISTPASTKAVASGVLQGASCTEKLKEKSKNQIQSIILIKPNKEKEEFVLYRGVFEKEFSRLGLKWMPMVPIWLKFDENFLLCFRISSKNFDKK